MDARKTIVSALICSQVCLLLFLANSCSTGQATPVPQAPGIDGTAGPVPTADALPALPADGLQPWETRSPEGYAIPAASSRQSSALSGASEFSAGANTFSRSSAASEDGDALLLDSGPDGGTGLAWGIYRLSLEGVEPGVFSTDVDCQEHAGGGPSEYWLALADYGRGAWQVRGPFRDNHVLISTRSLRDAGASFVSPLGNAFVAVLTSGGNQAEAVGVAADPLKLDSVAPPAPAAPVLTAVDGGLLVEWLPVAADDLAGYRVLYNRFPFDTIGQAGVQVPQTLEGRTTLLLSPLSGPVYVRVQAVDIDGNLSPLSEQASLEVSGTGGSDLTLTTGTPSGLIHSAIAVSATGGASYDWDLDGDGIYDVLGDTGGVQNVDTSRSGMIRPMVRARDGGGVMYAEGGFSLLISSNSRPVASAVADPESGDAPLVVTFTGDAEDQEDAPGDLAYAWDFDGDGVFEPDTDTLTPDPQTYNSPGIYDAKLRVTDTEGAWDVDTVPVLVTGIDAGDAPPTAVLSAPITESTVPVSLVLDGSGSSDPDGSIVEYAWDLDGDGNFDETGSTAVIAPLFSEPGLFDVTLRVTDDAGASSEATLSLQLHGWEISPNPGDGFTTSCAMLEVDGKPAIAFTIPQGVEYVRALDAEGHRWGDVIELASSLSDSFNGANLVLVDGNPAVCYQRTSIDFGTIHFVRAEDADGTTWPTPQLVATAGDDHAHPSLQVVDGNPALCFYSHNVFLPGDGLLKYIRSTDADGGSWGSPITLDSEAGVDVGDFCSLTVSSEVPGVSYRYGSSELHFMYSSDLDGVNWIGPITVDTTSQPGFEARGLVVFNSPAIVYWRAASHELMFVLATSFKGSGWNSPVKITSTTALGSGIAPVLNATTPPTPAVAYFDPADSHFYIAYSFSDIGVFWSAPELVDGAPNVGRACALANLDGGLGVAYSDNINLRPKFARKY